MEKMIRRRQLIIFGLVRTAKIAPDICHAPFKINQSLYLLLSTSLSLGPLLGHFSLSSYLDAHENNPKDRSLDCFD